MDLCPCSCLSPAVTFSMQTVKVFEAFSPSPANEIILCIVIGKTSYEARVMGMVISQISPRFFPRRPMECERHDLEGRLIIDLCRSRVRPAVHTFKMYPLPCKTHTENWVMCLDELLLYYICRRQFSMNVSCVTGWGRGGRETICTIQLKLSTSPNPFEITVW